MIHGQLQLELSNEVLNLFELDQELNLSYCFISLVTLSRSHIKRLDFVVEDYGHVVVVHFSKDAQDSDHALISDLQRLDEFVVE